MRILDFEKNMRAALSEAEAAYGSGEIPVGALVVREGMIIARAHNLVEYKNNRSAHAEMLAMEAALARLDGEKRLSGCTLYTTLEPCAMCAGAAVNFGVDMIVFGAYDEKFGCTGSRTDIPLLLTNGRIRSVGGVLREECEQIINRFFAERRGL